MLPFYLRHYGKFCDKIVVYDNQSTDRSRDIIRAFPNTDIRDFDSGGVIDEMLYLGIKNEAYKEEKGKADFVIVSDVDEFLYAPNVLSVLSGMKRRKETILTTQGVEMVSNSFPQDDGRQIWQTVEEGVLSWAFSKRVCFSPEIGINYLAGAHKCCPSGRIRMSNVFVYMLHFKWLGKEHVYDRYYAYRKRASDWNKEHGVSWKELKENNWVDRMFQERMDRRNFVVSKAFEVIRA
jgi:glycosyltransferase involved in cell wall biosynthesis